MRATKRPEALGGDVVIGSVQDLDAALHELAWLKARETELSAEADQKTREVTRHYQQCMVVEIDGEAVTLADRRKQLETVALEWADEHRGELLAQGGKTAELTHGKVAWRTVPEAITYAEAGPKGVVRAIEAICELAKALQRTLARVSIFGSGKERVAAIDLVTVEIKPSATAASALYKAGQITAEQLAEAGFTIRPESETVSITPAAVVVQSETAAAA